MKQKKIYYWSPYLSPIATCKAVLNSAESLMKYSSNYQSFILNFFGEFDKFIINHEKKKLRFIDHYPSLVSFLPYRGKLKSRLSFMLIFILGFFPLKKILKENKPDFLIIHLITSLPLILLLFFKFETKFILRISGHPKMNFLRKFLWKLTLKKIYLITCPTENTFKYIKSLNLVDASKIKLLYDPIINVKEINKKKNEKIDYNNFYLAAGRLTKQKNFMFLCKAFKEIIEENDQIKLLIAGNGEDEIKLKEFIRKNNLENNITLLGYIDNIFPYFKNSKGFILTSLWEDPGFVLIEAAFCRTPVFSSDAKPSPSELIENDYNGTTFQNNDKNSFLKNFKNYLDNSKDKKIILNNLKLSKRFTIFNHYKKLSNLIV